LLAEAQNAQFGFADAVGVVDNRIKYGLQIVRRAGYGAYQIRDGGPMPSDLSQLILQP
jgi:hypothetical protein